MRKLTQKFRAVLILSCSVRHQHEDGTESNGGGRIAASEAE